MRVILLRYIRFSCSARLSRAPESECARLPRPEAAFLGGPARGSQNRNGAIGKAEASQAPGAARAPKQCRDRRVEQETERKQFRYRFSPRGNMQVNTGEPASERIARDLRWQAKRREDDSLRAASTRLVATCTGSGDRRGTATQSDGLRSLALPRADVRWRVFAQRVVDAVLLVVADVLADNPAEVFFVHRDDMVEDLAPATSNPSFGRSVCQGA
jgi:hypothetical protein